MIHFQLGAQVTVSVQSQTKSEKKRIKKAKVQNRYRSWIPVGPLQDLCRNVNGEKIDLIISTHRIGE